MGKTSEVRSDGSGAETQGQGTSDGDARRTGRRRTEDVTEDAIEAIGGIGEAEHLQQDFAKVRAKVATDPVLASRSLSAAWTTDLIEEEDEAEFVDAVADCVGAGFSLESALTGWDNGTLAADGGEDGSLFDDESERDDDTPSAFPPRHAPTGGRRIVIT